MAGVSCRHLHIVHGTRLKARAVWFGLINSAWPKFERPLT